MKIEETKEVTQTVLKAVITGRKCDICGSEIKPIKFPANQYNYFVIHTCHSDWGNDSVDSHEYYDACSPECAIEFTDKYLRNAFDKVFNR